MADRETIIETGGDSSLGVVLGIIVVLAIAGIAWLFYSGNLSLPAPGGSDTNITITTPAPATPAAPAN
ncbi:MAG: hypothetical protein ABL879_11020 [Devosia sp.]